MLRLPLRALRFPRSKETPSRLALQQLRVAKVARVTGAALGTGRLRIARQLLTESVLLSLAGGGLGLLLAFWGVRALGQWSGSSLPAMHGIGIDGWGLAFSLGVSEVALALMLLIGAGLLLKSFSRLAEVHPGFRTDDVLTFQVNLAEGKTPFQKNNFIEQTVERLKALPGVQAAAATDSLPLTPFERISPADVEGRPPIDFRTAKPGEVRPVSRPTVTVDYFNAMGIPVKNGRAFTPQDARPAAGVVIVNEAFENYPFPGQSAVGKRIRLMAGLGGEARSAS